MVTCFTVATFISFFSIFCFFGKGLVVDVPNVGTSYSMFDLMFGCERKIEVLGRIYTVKIDAQGGMTFLFVVQIFVMVAAIIVWILEKKLFLYDKNKAIAAGVAGVLSLLSLILSFCTKPLSDVKDYSSDVVKLGAGPIIYSVMNIISVIIIIIGLIKWYNGYVFIQNRKRTRIASTYDAQHANSTSSNSGNYGHSKQELSETEKVELLTKYKSLLDSGIITKEEFEAKKKEILF